MVTSTDRVSEGFAYFRWRVLKNECCLLSCWCCMQERAGGMR